MALNNPIAVLAELAVGQTTVPVQNTDNTILAWRSDPSGSAIVAPRFTVDRQAALEGKSFVAFNPTIGTGVSLDGVHAAFSDTNGLFVIRNNATGTGPNVVLKYLRLLPTAATQPAGTVSTDLLVKLDSIVRSPVTLANGTNATPVNINPLFPSNAQASVIGFNANAMTLPAAGPAARVVARAHFATGIQLVGDEMIAQFGASDHASSAALIAAKAVAPGRYVANVGPVVIPPGWTAVIHRWSLTEITNTAAFEWELAWDEV